jgi:hypothetical protein
MASHPIQHYLLEGRMRLLVAYLHKGGLEVYRVSVVKGSTRVKVERFASGPVSELRPIRALGKKVLIVARGLCFHTRKRYPPVSHSDLKKAVQMDIEDITPVKAPMHHFKVFERTSAYALVDIWAWERAVVDGVRAVFAFSHVVPEDAAFVSQRPEIGVFIENGMASLVAYAGHGFIGSAAVKDLSRQGLEVFLKGLGRHGEAIEAVNIYGTTETRLMELLRGVAPEVALRQPQGYPVCIDYLPLGNLGQYKIQADYSHLYKGVLMALRFALYGTLSVALWALITLKNYEESIQEMEGKIAQVSKEASSLLAGPSSEDFSDILKELDVRLKDQVQPLKVMDLLAQHLPPKSHVTRLLINEQNMEVTVTSPDPLGTVKTLGQTGFFKTVKLRGTPIKGPKGDYTFTLIAEGR